MRKLSQGVFEISRSHIKEIFEQDIKTDILTAVKMKMESEKVGLKLNIQNTKIMESSPITS